MPPRRRTFEGVVRAAEAVLRSNRVEHVYVGGLSVMAFGVPRATVDVDVFADYGPESIAAIASGFRRRAFLVAADDLRDALLDRSHVTIDDTRSLYHIDLVPTVDQAKKHALKARTEVRLLGMTLPIARPEHTVVMKLKFGSDRDLEDAVGMLVRQQGKLDLEEMRRFARQQGLLSDLLAFEKRAEQLAGTA
jgi:hypothetical protein